MDEKIAVKDVSPGDKEGGAPVNNDQVLSAINAEAVAALFDAV